MISSKRGAFDGRIFRLLACKLNLPFLEAGTTRTTGSYLDPNTKLLLVPLEVSDCGTSNTVSKTRYYILGSRF